MNLLGLYRLFAVRKKNMEIMVLFQLNIISLHFQTLPSQICRMLIYYPAVNFSTRTNTELL